MFLKLFILCLVIGKYQEKKENNFFIFDFIMKNMKES